MKPLEKSLKQLLLLHMKDSAMSLPWVYRLQGAASGSEKNIQKLLRNDKNNNVDKVKAVVSYAPELQWISHLYGQQDHSQRNNNHSRLWLQNLQIQKF